jgi:hypothetical protein
MNGITMAKKWFAGLLGTRTRVIERIIERVEVQTVPVMFFPNASLKWKYIQMALNYKAKEVSWEVERFPTGYYANYVAGKIGISTPTLVSCLTCNYDNYAPNENTVRKVLVYLGFNPNSLVVKS